LIRSIAELAANNGRIVFPRTAANQAAPIVSARPASPRLERVRPWLIFGSDCNDDPPPIAPLPS
jgi:hypothetical protein